jgi:ATP synthase protein I
VEGLNETHDRRPDDRRRLAESVDRQAERLKSAEKDRPTLLAQTRFLGTIGLLFILPVIGGAYFGRWLDSKLPGYEVHWTVSMIFLGIVIGAVNVYYFARE